MATVLTRHTELDFAIPNLWHQKRKVTCGRSPVLFCFS